MKWNKYIPENNSEHIYMSGFLLMELGKMCKEYLTESLLEVAKSFGKRRRMFDLNALIKTFRHIRSSLFKHCALETVCKAQSVRSAPEFSWASDHCSINNLKGHKINTKIIHYASLLEKPCRRANQSSYHKLALRRVPTTQNRTQCGAFANTRLADLPTWLAASVRRHRKLSQRRHEN
jgi:lipopolysaccharide biosynthesis glycosyltransferase